MKKNYVTAMCLIIAICFANAMFAQHTKVKTITIINEDTAISENNINEKEMMDMDNVVNIVMNGDSIKGKKIVKKIIVNNDDENNVLAYAFSNDDKDDEVEVKSDLDGNTTRIIIKKDGDKSDPKIEKKVMHKSIITSGNKTSDESMSININVKNSIAVINVETGSNDPLNISVLDENGKQVFYDSQKNGKKYSKEIKLDKKGVYFLNLIQSKKSTSEKIIVE